MREADTHRNICDYLSLQYKGMLFISDGSGNNLSKAQAGMNTRLRATRAWPDLFIAEPRGDYFGLFLEIKREGTRVWLKNGDLSTDQHVQEQNAVLNALKARGYMAVFAVGFDEAKGIIDEYFSRKRVASPTPMVVGASR